jgi:hypothetical protein
MTSYVDQVTICLLLCLLKSAYMHPRCNGNIGWPKRLSQQFYIPINPRGYLASRDSTVLLEVKPRSGRSLVNYCRCTVSCIPAEGSQEARSIVW